MQDKLKEILKKISCITAHPDEDWFRIICIALVVLLVSGVWSVYFFFTMQSQILEANQTQQSVPASPAGANKIDDIKKTIGSFDTRKQQHDTILNNGAESLKDPASL